VMVGWEGTANDSRIFLKTITEPENGHYRHRENTILWTKAIRLCLAFFLSPYRGERYHLRDYREGGVPTTIAV